MSKTNIISDQVKCEILTTFGRIDVWVGLDRICLTATHVLQDILDCDYGVTYMLIAPTTKVISDLLYVENTLCCDI